MELNREHFRAIIFYNFRRGLTQQQCIDELNSIFSDEAPSTTSIYFCILFLAVKLYQGPVFIDGLVNSTEVLVHSKTNFMKVVQN